MPEKLLYDFDVNALVYGKRARPRDPELVGMDTSANNFGKLELAPAIERVVANMAHLTVLKLRDEHELAVIFAASVNPLFQRRHRIFTKQKLPDFTFPTRTFTPDGVSPVKSDSLDFFRSVFFFNYVFLLDRLVIDDLFQKLSALRTAAARIERECQIRDLLPLLSLREHFQ